MPLLLRLQTSMSTSSRDIKPSVSPDIRPAVPTKKTHSPIYSQNARGVSGSSPCFLLKERTQSMPVGRRLQVPRSLSETQGNSQHEVIGFFACKKVSDHS